MSLTHSDIAEIIRLVDQSTLDEFVVEIGDLKVEIRRKGAMPVVPSTPTAPAPAAPAPAASEPQPAASSPATTTPERDREPAAPGEPAVREGQIAVRSPMVGTFYQRPSPEESPYVEVGGEVELDAPLCLLEVMKLYTTIYATTRGRIARICASDAELVEYDQILFIIDPT